MKGFIRLLPAIQFYVLSLTSKEIDYLDMPVFDVILMHTIATNVCMFPKSQPKQVEKLQKYHYQGSGFASRCLAFNSLTGAE